MNVYPVLMSVQVKAIEGPTTTVHCTVHVVKEIMPQTGTLFTVVGGIKYC